MHIHSHTHTSIPFMTESDKDEYKVGREEKREQRNLFMGKIFVEYLLYASLC